MESIIGNYKYNNKIIGRGAFSVVYKGTDITTGDKVAIKEIFYKNFTKIEKEHLQTEIEIMKKVNHKNIIKLIDVITKSNENSVYIITEFCDRGTLHDLLYEHDKNLTEEKIQNYTKQLAEGLRYLQSFNVVHRDLKLTNILLTKDNIIKIADFGFAKEANDNSLMKTLCGSPGFMAPEILFHYKYNNKSDLWSLGMIVYHLIYKAHPYDPVSNIVELTHKIKNVKITYPYRRDVSDDCISLIKSLLVINPLKRISWNDFYRHPWIGLDTSTEMTFKLDDSVDDISNLLPGVAGNMQSVLPKEIAPILPGKTKLNSSSRDIPIKLDNTSTTKEILCIPPPPSGITEYYSGQTGDAGSVDFFPTGASPQPSGMSDKSIEGSSELNDHVHRSIKVNGKSHSIFENYIPMNKYKQIITKPMDIPLKGKQSASLYDFVSAPAMFVKKSLDYFNSL